MACARGAAWVSLGQFGGCGVGMFYNRAVTWPLLLAAGLRGFAQDYNVTKLTVRSFLLVFVGVRWYRCLFSSCFCPLVVAFRASVMSVTVVAGYIVGVGPSGGVWTRSAGYLWYLHGSIPTRHVRVRAAHLDYRQCRAVANRTQSNVGLGRPGIAYFILRDVSAPPPFNVGDARYDGTRVLWVLFVDIAWTTQGVMTNVIAVMFNFGVVRINSVDELGAGSQVNFIVSGGGHGLTADGPTLDRSDVATLCHYYVDHQRLIRIVGLNRTGAQAFVGKLSGR